uniref:hypothetical protein n=1 Tax=Trichocoleus desertorum TaxID=1481672 RepID=UPI0025B41C1F|nr:hypothetical protein [Trichocoleus desertorum]
MARYIREGFTFIDTQAVGEKRLRYQEVAELLNRLQEEVEQLKVANERLRAKLVREEFQAASEFLSAIGLR